MEPSGQLDPTVIVILVMGGIIALEAAVLGAWLWYRGRQLAKAEEIACYLRTEVRRLERADELRAQAALGKEMNNAEAVADFDHHDFDLDSGAS